MQILRDLWGGLVDRVNGEPVAVLAALRALVVLGTAFGLHLSVEQIAAIYLVMETSLSLIARQRVTPA
jgi:hypothetical protein